MKELFSWSEKNYSYLPWRKERSLYRTLVSEIMLQQTTVSTVMNRFENFMSKFPHLKDLAKAPMEEVLIAWEGLGYYRRARNLKAAAEMILNKFKGEFPNSLQELKSIKGIGDYTANAILAIGKDERALAIDANIERVLSRFYGLKEEKGPKLMKRLSQDFNDRKILVGNYSFRELNEALMDLGRVLCRARNVNCELCPLKSTCVAFKEQKQLLYPFTSHLRKREAPIDLVLLRVLVQKNDKYLVYQKRASEWLSGQWEFPSFVIETKDKTFKQYPKIPKELKPLLKGKLKVVKTGITKYNIQNHLLLLDQLPKSLRGEAVFKKLSEIQLSSACKKLLP